MKLQLNLQSFPFRVRFGVASNAWWEGFLANGNVTVEGAARLSRLAPLLPGARSDAAGRAVNNVILLSLPDEEYNLLRPHLEPVELAQHKILHEPGEKIDFAYFLNEGMTSLVAMSLDGRSVEVGITGREGMVGMSLTGGPTARNLSGNYADVRNWDANTGGDFSNYFALLLRCARSLAVSL